jgi:hypothetical protein
LAPLCQNSAHISLFTKIHISLFGPARGGAESHAPVVVRSQRPKFENVNPDGRSFTAPDDLRFHKGDPLVLVSLRL